MGFPLQFHLYVSCENERENDAVSILTAGKQHIAQSLDTTPGAIAFGQHVLVYPGGSQQVLLPIQGNTVNTTLLRTRPATPRS
ncbi:hypothetical protein ARTHRO9AX_10304 [Arthrobacter sp. 9AX]|nr:hypothetical protein ARTHRO9AX_10304 [Arthrobacter sp. 9AX]